MRNLFLFVFALAGVVVQAQEINWMSMDEALAAQKKEPKKIVMDVYADWCGPCKMMDQRTFTNKGVIDYINTHFYAVKFNAEGEEVVNLGGNTFTNPGYKAANTGRRNSTHQLVMALKVQGYPSMVYFNEEAELIQVIPGYHTPNQLDVYLKMIGSDDYLKVTDAKAWEDYRNNFIATF